jgi:hypothetical protein
MVGGKLMHDVYFLMERLGWVKLIRSTYLSLTIKAQLDIIGIFYAVNKLVVNRNVWFFIK